jgi:hypothetical protein
MLPFYTPLHMPLLSTESMTVSVTTMSYNAGQAGALAFTLPLVPDKKSN